MEVGAHRSVDDRWTSTVVLGDGDTALIRPIRPSDAPALAAFHDRQSPNSRYMRYFSPKPTLTGAELQRFTDVDFIGRAALVVELHGEFVAWASYEQWQNRTDAEVAFMVDDALGGRGIATLLLEHLAAIARDNGIDRFTAQTLGENRGMLAVFAKAGWPVHRRFDSGVVDVDFPLAETSEFIDSVERREQRADSRAVARLLMPASIAVIGASDAAGSVGRAIWINVSAASARRAYAVNPNHTTIGAARCYSSIGEIDDEIGLAIVAVPPTALEQVIDDCIARRVRSAIVITDAATSDVDVTAIVTRARHNGLRILGPGSMGIASPRPDTAIQAALVEVALPPGTVAISMQSGSLGGSLLRQASHLDLGLSWFVSLGDKADLSANDLLQFWEDDEATTVIGLYTESLGNPRKFTRIARRVSRRRPIVAVRTGAALVGPANDALYVEAGVIQVPTVTAMLDTARLLAGQPLPTASVVAVVTNSRSPGVLATATLDAAGVESVVVRLGWRGEADDYAAAIDDAAADDTIGALLVVHAPPVVDDLGRPAEAIDAVCRRAGKPTAVVMLGSPDGPLTPGSPVPVFSFPEPAAAAVARLVAYGAWRRTEGSAEHDEPPDRIDRARAAELVARGLETGVLDPAAVRSLLECYGIEMPETRLVAAADAAGAAAEIGFPVAVKAARRRPGLTREAGVALDLADRADVERAVAAMGSHLGEGAEHVHVQPMLPSGTDLRVRTTHDERVGPIVSVGLGGMQADLIGDESIRLAPVTPVTARAMVASTRAAAALDDAGSDALADVVTRAAQLASDHPEVVLLDLNPVIVHAARCHVADAAIELRRSSGPEPAVRRLEHE